MSEGVTIEVFLRAVQEDLGIDLHGYKLSTLERRLRHRMSQVACTNYLEYLAYLGSKPEEKARILDAILINVTEFFRDPPAWDVIKADVLPLLLKEKHPGDCFRAWVAGCASGEEAYTLAIQVAEYFGPHLPQYDIKIYATDVDDDALGTARSGQYHADELHHVHPELRVKYFQRQGLLMRVKREIRRMVIFGRRDLVHDAPLSHMELIVCRNVLIYFDCITQRLILRRLHRALETGGVLFLGKAESNLSEAKLFSPINSRWRIFQRTGVRELEPRVVRTEENMIRSDNPDTPARQRELSLLKRYHQAMLELLEPGILMLDNRDIVISENDSVHRLWGIDRQNLNTPIGASPIVSRCPELLEHVQESHRREDGTVRFQWRVPRGKEVRILQVKIRPVIGEDRVRMGTLIYTEDVSHRHQLQQAIEQLEATSEELQSANEELETANEALQSTNEELEVTNEELQATNEELETTNEELQALNEELENMNEELELRTRELDVLNSRYANTLEQMPRAVILVESDGRIQFWNSAAHRMFNLPASAVLGLHLAQLPIDITLRQVLLRKYRSVLEKGKPLALRNQVVRRGRVKATAEVQLSLVGRGNTSHGVLIMFTPSNATPLPVSNSAKSTKKSAKRASANK
jgi:two-component system CheB/CheR fusion protein